MFGVFVFKTKIYNKKYIILQLKISFYNDFLITFLKMKMLFYYKFLI